MPRINDHYLELAGAYLFPEIDRRVNEYLAAAPEMRERLIRCGIGDVTEPLPPSVVSALHTAVDEMADAATFRGYGPPLGYDFLREAIVEHDFAARGLDIGADEIFISDGSKTDCGAILDILAGDGANRVAIPNPVYPVYLDTNVMVGNTGALGEDGRYADLVELPCTAANDFIPDLPAAPVDVVYLCYPNNPTGGMIDRERLARWVAWALEHDALIIYDVAYNAFIQDESLPRSIYEIDGARRCAIESHSFSKNGGFTGLRCGYTVCPKELTGTTKSGERVALGSLWARRWSTKSNSVAYVVQRAAAALYSDEGQRDVARLVDHYMGNARVLREACTALGLTVYGGTNAPYVWVACPDGVDSWSMFDRLLADAQVVSTPGAGFGRCGEGYVRISAFNTRANVEEVGRRLAAEVAIR